MVLFSFSVGGVFPPLSLSALHAHNKKREQVYLKPTFTSFTCLVCCSVALGVVDGQEVATFLCFSFLSPFFLQLGLMVAGQLAAQCVL
eukprot:m.333265 g.333265  ORF g.333265 m.333265 type:complete len:88 (+) comp84090_c0_seq1:121-384(+)